MTTRIRTPIPRTAIIGFSRLVNVTWHLTKESEIDIL